MLEAAVEKGIAERAVLRLHGDSARTERDEVAVEEPLEIHVDGDVVATTMRTPGHDADLALGYLLAEGFIRGPADVGSVAHCGHPGREGYENVIDVRSAAGAPIDVERLVEARRASVVQSACGVCGRRSIEDLLRRCRPLETEARLSAREIAACVERLAGRQPIFARTGGLHAAAVFSEEGELLASAEDVGRHNAVDKVVGALLRRGILGGAGPRPLVLAVSGRAGFEIVQKAASAGFPFVAAVSAPSSLAVELAERTRVALVGFVRGARLVVYANAWRLEDAAGDQASYRMSPAPEGS